MDGGQLRASLATRDPPDTNTFKGWTRKGMIPRARFAVSMLYKALTDHERREDRQGGRTKGKPPRQAAQGPARPDGYEVATGALGSQPGHEKIFVEPAAHNHGDHGHLCSRDGWAPPHKGHRQGRVEAATDLRVRDQAGGRRLTELPALVTQIPILPGDLGDMAGDPHLAGRGSQGATWAGHSLRLLGGLGYHGQAGLGIAGNEFAGRRAGISSGRAAGGRLHYAARARQA